MKSGDNLFKSISQISEDNERLPPVDQWNPDYCGEMDLVLKANGEWIHNGQPMRRKKMIRLFSTILKKEVDRYYLVSPVEKIGIQVEWQPFVIIDFDFITEDNRSGFVFIDNCGNKTRLENQDQLQMDNYKGEPLPIIQVRKELYASFNRSCYYRLIEHTKIIDDSNQQAVILESFAVEFTLGKFNSDNHNNSLS